MYLGWLDDSKKPTAEKIAGGARAYQERFGVAPTFVLMNEADAQGVQVEAMGVLIKPWIRKNTFFFGMSDC